MAEMAGGDGDGGDDDDYVFFFGTESKWLKWLAVTVMATGSLAEVATNGMVDHSSRVVPPE